MVEPQKFHAKVVRMTSDLTDPYIEITSWLVSAYDFYSRVVKDCYMSVKMSV